MLAQITSKILDKIGLGKEFKGSNERILFLSRNFKIARVLRQIQSDLGTFVFKKEKDFFRAQNLDKEVFESFLKQKKIDKVFFANPYANAQRLEIYRFCKLQNIPFLVWDRGALSDAWFFDDKGFNFDSKSYNEALWNVPLNEGQISSTKAYINELLEGKNYLENQGKKQDVSTLRKSLNLGQKRVIFIPLQVSSDTVIEHFTYEPFSYENFLKILDDLACEFQNDFVFVAKKHPLSLDLNKKDYQNLIFAEDETNFLSLIQLSDFLILLNSGVGVYAMCMKKPCIVCANAFYHFKGLNLQAQNEEELRQHIKLLRDEKFSFDEAKMYRFLYFLRFGFYSFAKAHYKAKKERRNGILRVINRVVFLDFYQLIVARKIINLEHK